MGNKIVCNCGNEIPDEEIDFWNGCNEEGEDFGVVSATCPKCDTEYETNQWGEWDDKEDAKSVLQDYINENKK